ncbi:MAG: VOC family protein [Neisseriaceae bacterium]|nr:MAG: VOC family protein [Neisseriaceae bacterium]
MSNSIFNSVHHIAIIASNYQRSKQFYNEILGLQIIREIYRESRDSYKLDLQINAQTQIELFSFPSPPPRPSTPESCGLRHLAFAVDDLEQTIAHLASHNVECEVVRVDEFTGKKFTFFRDPDNLPLELYQK